MDVREGAADGCEGEETFKTTNSLVVIMLFALIQNVLLFTCFRSGPFFLRKNEIKPAESLKRMLILRNVKLATI